MRMSPFIPPSNTLIRPDKGCQLPAVHTAGSWLPALVLVLQCTLALFLLLFNNQPFWSILLNSPRQFVNPCKLMNELFLSRWEQPLAFHVVIELRVNTSLSGRRKNEMEASQQIRQTDNRITGREIKPEIIKLPKSTCFWLRAISSVVHLFDAVSAGRTAADAEQHNDSYAISTVQ